MVKVPGYDSYRGTGVQTSPSPIRNLSDAEIYNMSKSGLVTAGKALTDAGKQFAEIEKIKKKKQEEDNFLWVTKSIAEFKDTIIKTEPNLQEGYENETGSGYVEYAEKQYEEIAKNILANAPNSDAAKDLQAKILTYKPTFTSSSVAFEANTRVNYFKTEVTESINKLANIAYSDPYNVDMHLGTMIGMLDGIVSQKSKSKDYGTLLPPKVIQEIRELAKHTISTRALEGLIESDIKENIEFAIKEIESGKYNDKVESSTLSSLLNKARSWKEKVSAIAINELAETVEMNLTSTLKDGQEQTPLTLNNFLAMSDGSDESLEKWKAQYIEYEKDVAINKGIYSEAQGMVWLSESAINSKIEGLNPPLPENFTVNGTIDAGAYNIAQDIYKGTIQSAVNIITERNKDPFQFIMANDDSLRKDYQMVDDDEKHKEANVGSNAEYVLALQKIIRIQKSWGIRDEDLQYMTKNEEKWYIENLSNKNPNHVKAFMQSERNKTGEFADERLATVITSGDVSIMQSAALQFVDEKGFNELWNAAVTPMKDIDDVLKTKDMALSAEADAFDHFEPYVTALTQHATERSPYVAAIQNLLMKRAKQLRANGDYESLDEAFKEVVDEYYGKNFIIGGTEQKGTFLIPHSLKHGNDIIYLIKDDNSINNINAVLDVYRTKKYLETYDIEPLGSSNQFLPKDFLEDQQLISTNFQWRNSADGSGLELVYDFPAPTPSEPVLNKNGELITISWKKLSEDTVGEKFNETVKTMSDIAKESITTDDAILPGVFNQKLYEEKWLKKNK